MLFRDWRLLDQASAGLSLEKTNVYYIHSRAWALKGWVGGTHSWITFWCNQHFKWLVVEFSDKETIKVQNANILFIWDNVGYQDHSPIISDRIPDASWFGSKPIIVGKTLTSFTYDDILTVCREYPIRKFRLLDQNCNTFTSYVISRLEISIKKPLRAIGFRSNYYWINTHKIFRVRKLE